MSGCCGSIVHHLGREKQNRDLAAALIERLHAEHAARALEAIIVDASGCGTHLKDYGYMFRNDPELADKAETISMLARDVTEFLAAHGLPTPATPPGLTIAYHSACSMQHGQKIDAEPRDLLARAGFTVKEIDEGHLCCGSAGTYSILQPELSQRLLANKIAALTAQSPKEILTANIGCQSHLQTATDLPVRHWIEILDDVLSSKQ